MKLQSLQLNQTSASGFAQLALNCIQREYPNKLSHVMNNPDEVQSPSVLHPAFYGCFDWHSSVHGHWMLVRLIKLFPNLPEAADIRKALNKNLSKQNLQAEAGYLNQANRKSFERTYGWAWLLKLAEELAGWDDADGTVWSQNLKPLAQAMVDRYFDFLPRQTYPIRTGVHPNTAFGITFALDYARKTGHAGLENLLVETSLTYYKNDQSWGADWEPSGSDFFSPCLIEADLMRRVLPVEDFREWFRLFVPGVVNGEQKNLLEPAIVSDRSDPQIVHLDGLNLSRAWCMVGIASSFLADSPVREMLLQSAFRHAQAGLENVASGEYEGEHWLASFAVYLLSTYD
ncbi:MAG: DUF2891 domain-containing protein [Chloroflexi bacterium]|nr:DUF2891 domain-containing protein [Chloroflexota bacterium]